MTDNRNTEALRSYVDRMTKIEQDFNDAKQEHKDLIKDMSAEIKSRYDETGVEAKEVKRLTAIRLAEAEKRDEKQMLVDDLDTYDLIYGAATVEDDI